MRALGISGRDRRRAPQRWIIWSVAAIVALLVVARAGRASAQDLEPPRHRQGYYAALGLNAAMTETREKGFSLGPWFGNGYALRFGQLVTRRFSLGLAIELGGTKGDGQSASIIALGMESSWALVGNLAVRGGVGIGSINLKDPRDPFESSTRGATGAWFSTGLSYDWFPWKKRLSGGFAVTPTIQLRYLPGDDTWGLVTFAGVELTYWTGLRREQLVLPPSEAWRK
jgi:hypothetical protein